MEEEESWQDEIDEKEDHGRNIRSTI